MKKIMLAGILIAGFMQQACLPTIVAGAVAATNSSKKTKAKWEADLRQTNLEREKAHLKPLDWCDEAYKTNKHWAKKNKDCNK